MVCVSARRLIAGIFISSVVLAFCGCKKEEGSSGSGGGASGASSKDLDVIPVESDVVFSIDLAQAQKSALFKEYALPALTKSEDAQKFLTTLKTKCNIDPMASATRVTAGVKMEGRQGDVVAVLHGIEKSKALPCVDQVKEELAAEKVEATKDGDIITMKSPDGTTFFKFTGDTTAVMVGGPKASKERLLEVVQGKSQLKSSKEFADMYGKINAGHTVWFLVRGDLEPIAKGLEKLNAKAKAVFGSVNATDGLEARAVMRLETEEQATQIVDLAKNQGGMAAGMVQKLDIDRDKNDARVHIVMTADQVKSVAGFARGFMGGRR
ncbi:MAG TPA: hypothetical protein VNO30_26755 [Kofleriaceae bacterium]|nr:hypothetical protein [Kofleriaceae bacterium]